MILNKYIPIIFIAVIVFFLLVWLSRPRKAIVIVEPRKHKNLEYVIKNFDSLMDPDWDLYVFHGQSAAEFAAAAVQSIQKRDVILLPLQTDNLNADQYNELFKRPEFWNQVNAETILVFQTDVVLCSKSLQSIDRFTKYDYIGCSVDDKKIGFGAWWTKAHENDYFYGIGGMSLRKKSFMLQCIRDNVGIDKAFPEDVFFSNCVARSPNKPESATVINDFCTQNKYVNNSLGAHRISLLNDDDKKRFIQFCPEATAIQD